MVWVKTEDGAPHHTKFFAAGIAAYGWWHAALSYANRELTDGFIPARARAIVFLGIDDAEILTLATALVREGALHTMEIGAAPTCEHEWCSAQRASVPGWLLHDYPEYQPLRETILKERETKAEAGRKGGRVQAANRRAIVDALARKTRPRGRSSTPAQAPAQADAQALAQVDLKDPARAPAQAPSRPDPLGLRSNPVASTLREPSPETNGDEVANATGPETGEAPNTEPGRRALLLSDVLAVTRDPTSVAFYRSAIAQLPEERVRAILAETRDAVASGRIRKSPARMFTHLARKAIEQRDGARGARGP